MICKYLGDRSLNQEADGPTSFFMPRMGLDIPGNGKNLPLNPLLSWTYVLLSCAPLFLRNLSFFGCKQQKLTLAKLSKRMFVGGTPGAVDQATLRPLTLSQLGQAWSLCFLQWVVGSLIYSPTKTPHHGGEIIPQKEIRTLIH